MKKRSLAEAASHVAARMPVTFERTTRKRNRSVAAALLLAALVLLALLVGCSSETSKPAEIAKPELKDRNCLPAVPLFRKCLSPLVAGRATHSRTASSPLLHLTLTVETERRPYGAPSSPLPRSGAQNLLSGPEVRPKTLPPAVSTRAMRTTTRPQIHRRRFLIARF